MTNFFCRNFYIIVQRAGDRVILCNRVLFRFKQNYQQYKWSYDKMLIDWVRSGQTGKYLALGQNTRTLLPSVRTSWPRAKYFPFRPFHSVNKYILSYDPYGPASNFLGKPFWPRAKYFPVRPSHSVNKYIVLYREQCMGERRYAISLLVFDLISHE